jgi:hypothetical protein
MVEKRVFLCNQLEVNNNESADSNKKIGTKTPHFSLVEIDPTSIILPDYHEQHHNKMIGELPCSLDPEPMPRLPYSRD